ncbi:Glutathione S-transferase kappa 1 [Dissophora globulifera]|nr:Glutathione S-transferase kappa 1 [Dissophora globulifera]
MAVARAKIVLYYDVISPYSYMGFKLFNRYRQHWTGVDISFKPMLLGGVMNIVKNQPLADFPAKKSHMIADLDRTSAMSGVPFNFPKEFPVNTVLPMRVLTALQMHEASDMYEQCIDKEAYFVYDRNISKPDVIHATLAPLFSSSSTTTDAASAKVKSYLDLAVHLDIKQRFKEYTDEAVAKGIFGAPTFIINKAGDDNEYLFFGSDRFENIAVFLDQPYPGLRSLAASSGASASISDKNARL